MVLYELKKWLLENHICPERCVLIFEYCWHFYLLYSTFDVVSTHFYSWVCTEPNLACGYFIMKVIKSAWSLPLSFLPSSHFAFTRSFCHIAPPSFLSPLSLPFSLSVSVSTGFLTFSFFFLNLIFFCLLFAQQYSSPSM